MTTKKKSTITIYHLHLKDEKMLKRDYYFGSISAIFEQFGKKEVGILASSLYNLKLNETTNPIYENSKCVTHCTC